MVHDPAVDANVVSFCALGQGRESRRGEDVPTAQQRQGRDELQGRGRGEAGTQRERRVHDAIEAADWEGGLTQ